MKLSWEVKETNRKVGSDMVWNEAKGKKTAKARVVPTKYDFPVIEDVKTLEDFNELTQKLLASDKRAYNSVDKLIGHLVYGLERHVPVLLNMGRDTKLSENQRSVLKALVGLVRIGPMTRDAAVDYLAAQGVEDAGVTFDAFFNEDENGGEDTEDDTDEK